MKLSKFLRMAICAGLLLFGLGCVNVISSTVQSGMVYFVAKHDETIQKKQKKYNATDRCVVSGAPEALALGDAIAYGQPLTAQYNKILSRTGEDIDPVEPRQLAYAFYIIAGRIRDSRAKERIIWIEKQMQPEEIDEIQSIISDKYLVSHLDKCFTVPDEYKIKKTTRQFIMEEKGRMFEKE